MAKPSLRQRGQIGPRRVAISLGCVLMLCFVSLPTRPAWALPGLQQASGVYTNPVIAQTAPDPAIIKALDGYYYLIATSDYWQGGSFHILPIFRSSDLVHWTFVADSFSARPDWVDPSAGLWAPDLQYYNHKYYMYYAASWTKPLPKYNTTGGSAIGVATAPTPAGPWTDAGDSAGAGFASGPIVPPRSCVFNTDPGCYYWTFDPAEFTDQDGQKYLYYGSYFGGTLVQKLAEDGLHTAGPAIQIGHWDRYEGTYVIRHDINGQRYYYNFSSAADCCRGPNTAYSVEVSRATSPLGPFVDQNGFPMMRPSSLPAPTTRPSPDPAGDNAGGQGGGYPTLKQNGNIWNGVGHNALITDLSGHTWIVYHGVDKNNGWVNGAPANLQITFRQLLLDRIDWTSDGWPVVNGGAGPSNTPMPAPVTIPLFGDNFNSGGSCGAPSFANTTTWQTVSGQWSLEQDSGGCITGGYASAQGLVVSQDTAPLGSRVECDLRLEAGSDGRYGCVVSYTQGSFQGAGRFIAAFVDPAQNALVTVAYNNGVPLGNAQSTPLPAGFDPTDWHHLTIDQLGSPNGLPLLRFTLSDYGRDPLAVQERSFPANYGLYAGNVGFMTIAAQADFDNITVAHLDQTTIPEPQVPALGQMMPAYSDEFNGSLGPQWSWIRQDASKHGFVDGQLKIVVNGDLYRDSNDATNLLLEAPPAGNYVVETKITFDPNQNYQQAGLLVYSDDDHYIKVGPAHLNSLTKMISGHESLEPLPSSQTSCDVQPSATSNVAITTYTRDACPNEGESWDYLTNSQPTENGATTYSPTVTDWLRIYRNGSVYTPYYSLDDVHWIKGSSWTLEPAAPDFPIRIGLFAFSGGPHNDVPALFDYVHVYSEP